MNFILDERARELHWKDTEEQICSFGKFTGGSYLWPWWGFWRPTQSFRDLFLFQL
jgi:hypothetical protein